ncbi:GNAT family N-acetyltransferase [Ectobacillus panaciterrae]|uniref:GNAT family N-acetyltransferase n=1 Tax=Ectobacillus panaciterrae TaxID=363872 RepID=UPI0004274A08|nr:GNAT family N-acetyltransferase [Ectobacillus panaciterrae]
MNYKVRRMQAADIPDVQHIAKMSWYDTYEGMIPREVQDHFLDYAYSDEMMHRRVAHTLMFVAEADGKIVGFANFPHVNEEKEMELSAIYLLPAYQEQGIGTALLEAGLQAVQNAQKVYVNVESENQKGKRFYEARGFVQMHEFDDDFHGYILKTTRMVLVVT